MPTTRRWSRRPRCQPAKLRAPFVRYELVEDRFEREVNRNLIGRPEFFALGLAAKLQLGKGLRRLGSTRSPWLYTGSIGRGFEPWPEHRLMAQAQISGQIDDGRCSASASACRRSTTCHRAGAGSSRPLRSTS